LSPHGIHHYIHLLLYHLPVLGLTHRIDFYFRWEVSVLWLVSSAGDIAFFLIFPLLTVLRQEMTTILLIVVPFVTLVFGTSLVPLVQLLIQLLVALAKPFNCYCQGLHLPFQGVGGIPCLLVNGSYRSCLDHATLCLRSGGMANHSFPIDDTN